MMNKLRLCALFVLLICGLSVVQASVDVIPKPNHCIAKGQGFEFNENTRWLVDSPANISALNALLEQFRVAANYSYKAELSTRQKRNAVTLKTNAALGKEAYTLETNKDGVVIEAATYNGFFYAVQTLRQLLPLAIFEDSWQKDQAWTVPGLRIQDAPRFAYRGFMLDVSRHFLPKEFVLRLIDQLAMHKVNYLHFHLVDDNGWRLEIKKYPALTDEGAWRAERNTFFSLRPNPVDGEPEQMGGYYTQNDIREMVAYAQARSVEIIPEIEMPAHTLSSLAAYPNLACPTTPKPIKVVPGMGGEFSKVIYCAGNDSVYAFLEDMIDEVCELFPSEYIHLGGDEANKTHWNQCPLCQARIKEEGLTCSEDLQGYFIKRMAAYINGKGKKVMGWDELTNAEVPEGTTVMGWRGNGFAAVKAAEQGNPIIMTPAKALYFIRYQGPQWFEPYTYFGNNTLEDVYKYQATELLSAEQEKLLKGIQACLWTEFVTTPQEAEYMIFPRMSAFAENAWTEVQNKDWADFIGRNDRLMTIYKKEGLNYANSVNNLFHEVQPVEGHLEVSLSCIRPDVSIYYTLDGSEPKNTSQPYEGTVTIKQAGKMRAAAFKDGQRMGAILNLNCRFNKATGKPVIARYAQAYTVSNGLMGTAKNTDGEYLDLYNQDGEFTIDLLKVMEFDNVVCSFLNNSGAAAHLPAEIEVLVSDDNKSFQSVQRKSLIPAVRFEAGVAKKMIELNVPQCKARFVKVKLTKPGICPPSHVRAGQFSRMAVDEVIIN